MALPMEELRARLGNTLSAHRYSHSLAVAEYGAQLAQLWKVDREQAYQAGLLHDMMHYLTADEYLSWALIYGLRCDEAQLDDPQLLHGPLAAAVLAQDYSCRDEALLQAIRCHTLPEEEMCDLAKLIFLADKLEPTRPAWPGQEELRQLARRDLNACLAACLRQTMDYLRETGRAAHPDTGRLAKLYQDRAKLS